MSLHSISVGAFNNGNETLFRVWAPEKEKVAIEFSDSQGKSIPLTQRTDGYWQLRVNSSPGTKYRYVVDDAGHFPDPASRSQPDGVHGFSEVIQTDFDWTDGQWRGISLGDLILYEVHTGCFTSEHNFEGIRKRLGYLQELGVNAIEIMPVAAFPGKRNWGYDGVFPFAVQSSYGGAAELKALVNEAHQKGIAVILDVVYNHAGPDGNYLPSFAPYFTEKYKSFWGASFNFDDAYCDGVRNFILQNALMWLDEFHIDGLRLDAVHAIIDLSSKHLMQELQEKVMELENASGIKKMLIAEIDLNDPKYIDSRTHGGYGLDGQWVDEFHHALHALMTGEKIGYYQDFGSTDMLVKAITNTYCYDGNYSVHRKRKFGASVLPYPADRFVVFTQNHDQTGNRMLGDRLSKLVSFGELKLAAATMLLSPYIPLLFMGEEYGETNPFLFFIDHTDEKLLQQTREGRKKEFAHFHFAGKVPDPASEESFLKSCLSWNVSSDAKTLFNWYQFLISFRKTRPAMQGRQREQFDAHTPADQLIVINRRNNEDRIQVLLNFSKSPQSIRIGQDAKRIVYSHSPAWGGDDATIPESEETILLPHSVSIYEY